MSNGDSDFNENRLYIEDILIECISEDADKTYFDDLQLAIVNDPGLEFGLARTSETTWQQITEYPIPVSKRGFWLVVTSGCLEEPPRIHIDLGQIITATSTQDSSDAQNEYKRDLKSIEGAPGLSLSFKANDLLLDEAISRWKEAFLEVDDANPSGRYTIARLFPDHYPLKAILLNCLGDEFLENFQATLHEDDIQAAVQAYEQAATLLSADDPKYASFIADVAQCHLEHYDVFEELPAIEAAIVKWREAVALISSIDRESDEKLAEWLTNLGISLGRRFEHIGEPTDIEESIQLHERAVQLTPDKYRDLPARLNNLGTALHCRFEKTASMADIAKSIQVRQRALELTPDGHARLPSALSNLGTSFRYRFEATGELEDLSQSIQLQERAVSLTPEGQSNLPLRLNSLANAILRRFERVGELSDVSKAIELQQRAAYLTELEPASRSTSAVVLDSLGASFVSRFERTGDPADIFAATQHQQRAITLIPDEHADLPGLLNNLGTSFIRRFELTGDLIDISESIQALQRAVQLTPEGHANLPSWLSNLSMSFRNRFERNKDLLDLSESIELLRQAVDLTPGEHANLASRLRNLGNALFRRFEESRKVEDIDESIELLQRDVDLTPDGHAALPGRLCDLGGSLLSRFEQSKDLKDISTSIEHQERAVQLTTDGHPSLPGRLSNLGGAFLFRFEQTQQRDDILRSAQLRREAVRLTPEGHADLSVWLNNFGNSFVRWFEYTGDEEALSSALSAFRQSSLSSTGSSSVRMIAARTWARLSQTSSPLLISEVIDAHETIIHLLSLVAGLENTLKRRHDILVNASPLTNAAAAAAFAIDRTDKALEWLEQGRCIVWNQINQLHSPLSDLRLHDADLAERLALLSGQLEHSASRTNPHHAEGALRIEAKISLETEALKHMKLARERDEVLATIRNIAGFDDFLLPRKYEDLVSRLPSEGYIIIINAAEDRCDALALTASCDKPIHIPLEKFEYKKAANHAKWLRKYLADCHLQSRYSEGTASGPRAFAPYKRPGSGQELQNMLQGLWTDLVEPVIQTLKLRVPEDGRDLPRIWWCPTGPIAFLPIHAAGIYKAGKETGSNCCLADFAVSSYIPTLSALDRLRSRPPDTVSSGVLMISQPDTPGLAPIPKTTEEVQKVREELDRRGIRSVLYAGKEATLTAVSEALESFSCVHIASHASQNVASPLESAVHLYDGSLKLVEIAKKSLPGADLAFMSACQTSSGDDKLPEEAVHLAAGMLAAGYRSVVATMWSINDRHAPEVADTFYRNILSSSSKEGNSKLDVTSSAHALHITIRQLREKLGDSTEALLAWVPYIHLGV